MSLLFFVLLFTKLVVIVVLLLLFFGVFFHMHFIKKISLLFSTVMLYLKEVQSTVAYCVMRLVMLSILTMFTCTYNVKYSVATELLTVAMFHRFFSTATPGFRAPEQRCVCVCTCVRACVSYICTMCMLL